MSAFFNTFFYEPILNGLVYLIDIVPFHDMGLVIVILTVIVRLIIFPIQHRATIMQKKMKELEPQIKDIKEKNKDAKEQTQKIMELYKEHNINPFSFFSLLAIFLQIPIFFAMYKVFVGGVNFDHSLLYSFVSGDAVFNTNFLGLFDVAQKSVYFAALAGISQFIQIRLAIPPIAPLEGNKKGDFKHELAKSMNIQMRYVMPIIIFFVATKLPAALSLYWLTMNVFSIVHEYYVRQKAKNMLKTN